MITREMENALPSFNTHKEAYEYFKRQYGSDFVFESVEPINDMNCYFYALISDHGTYRKGRKLLIKGQAVTGELGMQFLKCYQSIQIMENGHVHIVH